MKVTKKHKLYYKDHTGSLRRFDKASIRLYYFIIHIFLKGYANIVYAERNKEVKKWDEFTAIDVVIPEHLTKEFELHFKNKTTTITYNGHWKPLARLIPQVLEEKYRLSIAIKN